MNSQQRILRVGIWFGVGLLAVLANLWWVMIEQHDAWLLRSYRNRWAFRDVPSWRGALCDREGRVLVADEASYELVCAYDVFTRAHVVGATVDGASEVMRLIGQTREFTFAPGADGPEHALAVMLDLDVADLGPDAPFASVRPRAQRVLAGLCGRTAASVRRQVTEVLQRQDRHLLWQLAGMPRAELERRFAERLRQLDLVEAALGEQRGGLLHERLQDLRERYVRCQREDRQMPALVVGRRLPFELAAALQTVGDDHPGFWLDHAVDRQQRVPPGSTLATLLGSVKWNRDLPAGSKLEAASGRERQLAVEAAARRALDDEDRDLLVPDEMLPDIVAESYRERAAGFYSQRERQSGRLGVSGLERGLDHELAGRVGVRLVERDKGSREQRLYANLKVQAGGDVTLSLDFDLQRLVGGAIDDAMAEWRAIAVARGADPDKLAIAVALMDARTGEILANEGAPTEGEADGKRTWLLSPALGWSSDGSLGSVVKPFVLIEQMRREAAQQSGLLMQEFGDCDGRSCGHSHGAGGRDPVLALGRSCNHFFYRASDDLGFTGLVAAFARFGLAAPVADDAAPSAADNGTAGGAAAAVGADGAVGGAAGVPSAADAASPPGSAVDSRSATGSGAAAWQEQPVGLRDFWASRPQLTPGHYSDRRRSIGYGVAATPVMVARAYAALCTGSLPEATFLHGRGRPPLPLGIDAAVLETVRAGLEHCVTNDGTARDVLSLRRFPHPVGKTGTAEIHDRDRIVYNNAWFAGYLPEASVTGVQLCFAAAIYHVPDRVHGADAAGALIGEVLQRIVADPELSRRYLARDGR